MSNYNEIVGLLKEATIVAYDEESDTIEIQLNTAVAVKGGSKKITISIPAPHSLWYSNGLFIGSKPKAGTPIIVGQGSGGGYYFVSFKSQNLDNLPVLKEDEILLQASENAKIKIKNTNQITIGSDINNINIDIGNNNITNLVTFNFENENHFTQGTRHITGVVKRDLRPNFVGFDQDSKLVDDSYDSTYKVIGLDPTTTANNIITGPNKNPAFVENREIVYEFQDQSHITNDLEESLKYSTSNQPIKNYTFPNRRKSRGDTLSLTLLEPNYLMETVKGTVVDIFGNILDLNRMPLPIGKEQNTFKEIGTDKVKSFNLIKELERKSLAFHFEINARKDLAQKSNANSTLDLLNINSNKDNSRLRSRFFIDIDKEGQFKINIPASSEKGNIPLLTRYENKSSYDPEDNNNPNKLLFDNNNLDIFLDSFAAAAGSLTDNGFKFAKERGSIKIQDSNGEAAPIDRITESHIKHGMAHHDIFLTGWLLQNNDFIKYQAGTSKNITVDISTIPVLKDIVSDTIKVSGEGSFDSGGPNAGGRSGSFNADGMLEFNIGANTIDRQSLWMDLAGGSVINLGRDRNMRSAVVGADGDIYLQVGGVGISGDTRFIKENNGFYGAVFDLRVATSGGYTHMFRCDNNGVTLMTPGNMAFHAKGNIKFSSDANMEIDVENFVVQQRVVNKVFGGSI